MEEMKQERVPANLDDLIQKAAGEAAASCNVPPKYAGDPTSERAYRDAYGRAAKDYIRATVDTSTQMLATFVSTTEEGKTAFRKTASEVEANYVGADPTVRQRFGELVTEKMTDRENMLSEFLRGRLNLVRTTLENSLTRRGMTPEMVKSISDAVMRQDIKAVK